MAKTRDRDEIGLLIGAVAKVSSEREIVINRGSENGLEIGTRFQILSRDGEPVIDPETNEVIDEIPYEKARVEVAELYPRSAIAKTYGTHFVGGNALAATSSLTEMFGPRREVYDTFRADVTPSDSADRDMTVRVGDRVREIPSKN